MNVKSKNTLYIIVFFSILKLNCFAQNIETTLISKMDNDPQYTLWDGTQIRLMGFTSGLSHPIDLPSPVLNYYEGDTVELRLMNFSQSAPHTIHLHGLDVNQINDGVPNLSFQVEHDSSGVYHFVAPHPGTYLYHCHVISPVHVQAGMYGMLIVKPKDNPFKTWENGYDFVREYNWLMSEVDTNWHTDTVIHHIQESNGNVRRFPEYNPQYYLVNGRAEQQLEDSLSHVFSYIFKTVYLRLANIGYYGNHIRFPASLNALIVSGDGRPLPMSVENDTLTILPGERYGVLLHPQEVGEDLISLEYFDLNTRVIKNTQQIPVKIEYEISVDDLDAESSIKLSPMPVVDMVTLQFTNKQQSGIYKIQLFNIQGKYIKEWSEFYSGQALKFNANDLSSGVYQLCIQTPKNETLSILFVKK